MATSVEYAISNERSVYYRSALLMGMFDGKHEHKLLHARHPRQAA